ncbi:MAG: RluA family pseudouridine synthase [Anaerolineales bacterium]
MDAYIQEWILFADEYLIVLNKPAGLRSLPDGYNPSAEHLLSLLQPFFGKLWIVHRLDKDTSGVIVLTRTPEAHRSLNQQFEQRTVKKIYHAIIHGKPSWREMDITDPLKTNGDRRHRTVIDYAQGKMAQTHCRVLEYFPNNALVELHPKTGRTHQLRTHLAYIHHPILGDQLYTPAEIKKTQICTMDIERLALHAYSIQFTHPTSNQPLEFSAPYPPDFRACLARLGAVSIDGSGGTTDKGNSTTPKATLERGFGLG